MIERREVADRRFIWRGEDITVLSSPKEPGRASLFLVRDHSTDLIHKVSFPSEPSASEGQERGVLACLPIVCVEWPDYEYLSPTTGVEQVTCPVCRGLAG